jgi:hypothetical protein
MAEHEASRTLVKSPPELWAECSDASSLERHLGQFGEIRITRLEPETAVAWEGAHASGTVRLEPSGWGTRVIITAARVAGDELEAPVADEAEPAAAEIEPDPAPPVPERRIGLLARIIGLFRSPPPQAFRFDPPRHPAPEPVAPMPMPDPIPDPDRDLDSDPDQPNPADILVAALDSLGQAHHRPFSRG